MFVKKSVEKIYADIKETDYDDLSKGILKEKSVDNDYQAFLDERKAMLSYKKEDRDKIELIIKLEILKIFREAREMAQGEDDNLGYFKYKPFRAIELLKENFPIISVSGDRNMGKSYSSHEEIRDVVAMDRRFMMIRNIDNMMANIAIMNDSIAQKITEVSGLSNQVEASVGNAVRGLQFEDMASQMVDFLSSNTLHFKAMSDEVHIGLGLFKVGDNIVLINELEQGITRLNEMKQQWSVKERKAVSKSTMAEGEIDLF